MIGTIERIKNSVLLKCSTLNDEIISKTLEEIIDTRIYRFAEEMVNMIGDMNVPTVEETLRQNVSNLIKTPIIKKIKRKLFIDSLALQITNDSYIEDYVNGVVTMDKLNKSYVKELEANKSSNQLNMTEDLNLEEIINKVRLFVDKEIIPSITENSVLVDSVKNLVSNLRKALEDDLEKMIEDANLKYLGILAEELKEETNELKEKEIEEEKGEEEIMENAKEFEFTNDSYEEDTKTSENKFDKYDDMTLFNKVILSLNTAEEKLSRKERKLEESKKEVDATLSNTNKNIEANIERENSLSQRKLELNTREVELNSKLSETEVIFLNMKPLIKGLSKIKDSTVEGGNDGE